MAVVKKSVAFDEKVVKQAIEKAGERGFSRYVNDAVAQRLQAERIYAFYDQFVAEHGPVPDDIVREVEEEWAAAFGER